MPAAGLLAGNPDLGDNTDQNMLLLLLQTLSSSNHTAWAVPRPAEYLYFCLSVPSLRLPFLEPKHRTKGLLSTQGLLWLHLVFHWTKKAVTCWILSYIYIYILLYTYNYWNQQNPNQLTRKLDTLWWQQTSTCFQHCVMPDTLLMSCCITSESIQWKGCCNVPQPPQPPTGPGRCSGECWRSTCMGALGQLTDRKGSEEVQWISFR